MVEQLTARALGEAKLENLPLPIEQDALHQVVSRQHQVLMKIIEVACGVALIRGKQAVEMSDVTVAIKITKEGPEKYLPEESAEKW